MDAVCEPQRVDLAKVKPQVWAKELIAIINSLPPQIKILSLDCFDTIIWRKTSRPTDVFYDLQSRPAFKSLGFTAFLRMRAEGTARQAKRINDGSSEVTLDEIYRAAFPALTDEQLKALAHDEISAEKEACFAFPPIIDIINAAHKRGMKIIIVSDTYLSEKQLRHLLENTIPANTMQAIKKIYCSSEHGVSKTRGLFKKVLKNSNVSAQAILHIGDNLYADFNAARKENISALQLLHHDFNIANMYRMQVISGCFLDGNIRDTRPMYAPFRGVFATSKVPLKTIEHEIGYYSVGQILYSFAQFIRDEVNELRQAGKRPKVLFLMRDAYLPSLVCEAIEGKPLGPRVRISRFAAIASKFRTKNDVHTYLTQDAGSKRFEDMARQLLLPKEIAAPIIEAAEIAEDPLLTFTQLIEQEECLKIIFAASAAYRSRLLKHLKNEADIQPGDTLVFVDLGYTGTAQIELTPIFADMNIEVVGRYLVALQTPGWQVNRRGLLDSTWCDHRTMQTLVAYIPLFEQMCTSNDASVVDFDDNGNPIFSNSTVDAKQSKKNSPIQAECVRFAKDAEVFFNASKTQLSRQMLRDAAMAELGRLLFFPTRTELDYLQSFQFDFNLGTENLMETFNPQAGLTGLRERGLFFMERDIKTMRTNYPAELRSAGVELSLTLMAGHRYGLNLMPGDMSLRKEILQMLVVRGNQTTQAAVEAQYTYDGYYSVVVPVGNGDMHVGLSFGANYEWVQIHSANLVKFNSLLTSSESLHTIKTPEGLYFDKLIEKKAGLYECVNEQAILAYLPKQPISNDPDDHYVLRVVFRPIVSRTNNN